MPKNFEIRDGRTFPLEEQFLTEEQFRAFGRIVYGYCCVEVGLKFCIIGIVKMSMGEAFIMMAPYTAYNLDSVTKSLAREYLSPELAEGLISLVNRWSSFTAIRTRVAHHTWRAGKRPQSIKPTYVDIKSGVAQYKGYQDEKEERDYSTEELFEIGNNLGQLNRDVKLFLLQSGLRAVIEQKIDAVSIDGDPSDDLA